MNHAVRYSAFFLSTLLACPAAAVGQGTFADYQRAADTREQLDGLTVGIAGEINWVGSGGEFWYRVTVDGGWARTTGSC